MGVTLKCCREFQFNSRASFRWQSCFLSENTLLIHRLSPPKSIELTTDCVCWRQIYSKNKNVAHGAQTSVSLVFLPQFDVFCDALPYRPSVTWNLFVLYNKEAKFFHLCVCSLIDHKKENAGLGFYPPWDSIAAMRSSETPNLIWNVNQDRF